MKKKFSIGDIIRDMITTHVGSISSKIIVGATTYFLLTVVLVILCFVNPGFPGLSELISVLLITSASLLGLTTVENIKQPKNHGKIED